MAGSEATNDSSVRLAHVHKEMITKVITLEKPHRYMTASKDGTVRVWNAQNLAYMVRINRYMNALRG